MLRTLKDLQSQLAVLEEEDAQYASCDPRLFSQKRSSLLSFFSPHSYIPQRPSFSNFKTSLLDGQVTSSLFPPSVPTHDESREDREYLGSIVLRTRSLRSRRTRFSQRTILPLGRFRRPLFPSSPSSRLKTSSPAKSCYDFNQLELSFF